MTEGLTDDESASVKALLPALLKALPTLDDSKHEYNDYQNFLPVKSILKTGTSGKKTLKLISMKANYRQGHDPISVTDLKDIRNRCPQLQESHFDLPMFPYDSAYWYYLTGRTIFEAKEALDALTWFENLTNLTLSTQVGLGTMLPALSTSSTDIVYHEAENIMKWLFSSKIRVPFKKIELRVEMCPLPPNWRPRPITESLILQVWHGHQWFSSRISGEGV